MKELTLDEFAMLLGTLPLEVMHENHEALEHAARIVEKEAKDVLGTYRYGWPQLAPSTQEDRERQGFPANEPLLRTGEMRDSIEHSSDQHEARIGSNNDVAVYQELGTRSIPPRPFLQGAMRAKTPEILEEIGRRTVAALSGTAAVVGPNMMIPKP